MTDKPTETKRRMGKFQVYPVSKGAYHFCIIAANGNCVAIGDGDGDGYATKANAVRGAEDCRDAICQVVAGGVPIEELDHDPHAKHKKSKPKPEATDGGA